MRLGFEVGSGTGTNVPVISVIHRVRTSTEIKMVMPKGGGIDPGSRADPISPNLLLSFASRSLLHNLYKISLARTEFQYDSRMGAMLEVRNVLQSGHNIPVVNMVGPFGRAMTMGAV